MSLAWTPISVIVPEKWIDRCREYTRERVKWRRGQSNWLRKDQGKASSLGIGKLAEVATALGCGVDPEVIDWDAVHPEPEPIRPWDFPLGNLKVEVKSTDHPQGKRMLYPVDRTPYFDAAEMDVFIFVWVAKPKTKNFGYCELRGWSLKDEFKANKHIVTKADWKRYRGITPGTWSLDQDFLMPMGVLLAKQWENAEDLRWSTYGAAVSTAEGLQQQLERYQGIVERMEGKRV